MTERPRRTPSLPLEWGAVYERLAKVQRAIEAGSNRAPEEIGRILRERAEALAAPPGSDASGSDDDLHLLLFSLGDVQCAIDAMDVEEVVDLRDLTPVPCVPAHVLGVVNRRSRMLAVLDLRPLFDVPGGEVPAGSRVIVVKAGADAFGMLAVSVSGVLRVGRHEVLPAPSPGGGAAEGLTRGVVRGMAAVLDVAALIRDPRILVNDSGN